MLRRPVRRSRSGRFQLRLAPEERDLLRSLPGQLKELLTTDDPSLRRLFPPAYLDDPARDAEFQRLMRDDLLERHRAALDIMAATVDADELDADQLAGWLSAINDLRLVLGTQLDVSEDDVIRGETPLHHVYLYLTYLEESVVETLAGW